MVVVTAWSQRLIQYLHSIIHRFNEIASLSHTVLQARWVAMLTLIDWGLPFDAVNAQPLLCLVVNRWAQYGDSQLLRHVLILRNDQATLWLFHYVSLGEVLLDGGVWGTIPDRIVFADCQMMIQDVLNMHAWGAAWTLTIETPLRGDCGSRAQNCGLFPDS